MAKKRSNGEGSITYDKRRKRYRAKVTVGWEMNEETGRTKQITKSIGSNFKTRGEAARALAEYQNESYNLENKDITFEELFEFSESTEVSVSTVVDSSGVTVALTLILFDTSLYKTGAVPIV